jgi:hypothetical protein
MPEGFSNPENKLSKELSHARQKSNQKNFKKYEGLHDEFIKHPKAQYQMSFTEYKKLRRNQKKFAIWVTKYPFLTEYK